MKAQIKRGREHTRGGEGERERHWQVKTGERKWSLKHTQGIDYAKKYT